MTLAPDDRRALLVEVARHTPPVEGKTLTMERLCAYLGISEDTLRDRINEGALPEGKPLPIPGGRRSHRLYWRIEDVDEAMARVIWSDRPRRGDAVATR